MSVCPGCGAALPALGLDAPTRYHASGECWALFGELAAWHAGRADLSFPHQLAVDAYGAQHAGGSSRPITTAFSLIGLYLVNVCGSNGREVQLAHMRLDRSRFDWPVFDPPAPAGTPTVQGVLLAVTPQARAERLREWSASVWGGWAAMHGWAEAFCAGQLGPTLPSGAAPRVPIAPRPPR